MSRHSTAILLALFAPGSLALGLATVTRAQDSANTKVPYVAAPAEVVAKIKEEGADRSKVMETLAMLSDVIGPRLTGSPQMKRANEWTRDKMAEWGLENAHLEAWGPFGKGWSLKKFSIQAVEPQCIPLIALPKAWSPGLEGGLTSKVVYFNPQSEEELQAFENKLTGTIVLVAAPRETPALFEPSAKRYTEGQLLDMANAPSPEDRPRRRFGAARPGGGNDDQAFRQKKEDFLRAAKPALLIEPSFRGDGGTVFVQSASVSRGALTDDEQARRKSPWAVDAPPIIPQVVMAIEHYNRLVRMVEAGETPTLEVTLDVEFHDADLMAYNTIAEIPGSDPSLKDEVVMLGGHLDSWHCGTGATDNASGCAVAMEAVRIIQALDLKPRRTVRVALWSGEEQGLYGSRAYVKQHFVKELKPAENASDGEGTSAPARPLANEGMDILPMTGMFGGGGLAGIEVTPEAESFNVYFNLDNGTGKIRGIYMEGNEAVRPIFRRWFEPFRADGAATLTISRTGGTDHMPFNAIGLPGFQFIQDPVEYDTRTHHSTMDVYDRLQADDLKQASIIMATMVYNAAMSDEKLPRRAVTPSAAPSQPVPTQTAAE